MSVRDPVVLVNGGFMTLAKGDSISAGIRYRAPIGGVLEIPTDFQYAVANRLEIPLGTQLLAMGQVIVL
jgi:hypothetical protein